MFGEIKKSFGDDSRINYQAYNKSTIFENTVKETGTRKLKHQSDDNRFEPKFQDLSSQSRKFKEVWNPNADIDQLKGIRTNSTFGHFRKEHVKRDEGVEEPKNLDHTWKKKLAELNPKLNEQDIKQIADNKGTDGFYARRSLIAEESITTHKDAKVKELQSNIFNDLVKIILNFIDRIKMKIPTHIQEKLLQL